MASNPLREMFDEVESLSDSYAHLATELSDKIAAFEERLRSLKGKIEVHVCSAGGLTLRFGRASAGGWALYAQVSGKAERSLTSASVDTKARAVCSFVPLVEQMVKAHKARREQLGQSCGTMSSIIAKLGIEVEEGK